MIICWKYIDVLISICSLLMCFKKENSNPSQYNLFKIMILCFKYEEVKKNKKSHKIFVIVSEPCIKIVLKRDGWSPIKKSCFGDLDGRIIFLCLPIQGSWFLKNPQRHNLLILFPSLELLQYLNLKELIRNFAFKSCMIMAINSI